MAASAGWCVCAVWLVVLPGVALGLLCDEYWQANRDKTLIKAAGGLVDGILKNLKGQHIDETLVREMLLQTTTAKDKENIMDQVLQTEEVKDKIQLAQMPPPKRARMATSKWPEKTNVMNE